MLTRQDELIIEPDGEIVLPYVEYKTITYGEIKQKNVYTGRIIPIPYVLMEYLGHMELRVFSLILDSIRTKTICYMSLKEMSRHIGCSDISACNAFRALVSMGIVTIMPHTRKKGKAINWKAIEYLTKILENRKFGAASFLRKKIGQKNVLHLTELQVSNLDIFGGCADEVENEEYD